MKKLFQSLQTDGRGLIMRLLARLHCGLLAAVLCAVAAEAGRRAGLLAGVSVQAVYLRGLLFGIPVALSYYAAKRLPALWQYLLASLGIVGLSWLLLGHAGGAVMAAAACLFRGMARLSEEKSRSLFDAPHIAGLLLPLLVFCLSAVYPMPTLQRLSVLSAALYLLVLLAFQGVEHIDGYLTLNRDMGGVPVRRIQRIAGGALCAAVVLAAVLLLPAALGFNGDFQISLPRLPRNSSASSAPQEETPVVQDPASSLGDMFGDQGKPAFQIPEWVSYLLYAVIAAALILLALYGVYKLFKNFRLSYSDGRDVIQSLTEKRDEEASFSEKHRDRLSVLDRSPSAVIRRRYRKLVLKAAEEPPRRWQAPAEIEAERKLTEPLLHELYEKARYSPSGCGPEDVRALKELVKKGR